MGQVQDFLQVTSQVTVPINFFLQPLFKTVALLVRPKTRDQKFFRKEVKVACPAQAWKHLDTQLPGADSKLGISRAKPYSEKILFGRVQPTARTATMETTSVPLPPTRLTAINEFFEPTLKAQYGSRAAGAARLIQPSGRAAASGTRANSMAMAVGPVKVIFKNPTSVAARKAGKIGKLSVSFYVATMDSNLHVTFPEHPGYAKSKTVKVPRVAYSSKVKAAIRLAMLQNFKALVDDPKAKVEEGMKDKVYSALGLEVSA